MFPRNENRNEGTFGCSPGTKTGTRVRSHVPLERKPEREHIRQNHPFTKPTFYLPMKENLHLREGNPWRFQLGGVPTFSGMVRIVSQTLSGLFLVRAFSEIHRPRKRKGQIGKIHGESPDKSGKSQKNRESPKQGQKRKKRGRTSPDRETPPF